MEDAVDTEAHPQVTLGGLEVDVRGPFVDGAAEQLVDEGGHRTVGDVAVGTGAGEHVAWRTQDRADVDGVRPVGGCRCWPVLGRHEREVVEAPLDCPSELVGGGDHQAHGNGCEHPQVVDGLHVPRVGDGDGDGAIPDGYREHAAGPAEGLRDVHQCGRVRRVEGEVPVRESEHRRQLAGEVDFVQHPAGDQGLAEALPGASLLLECRVHLGGRGEPRLDQVLAERHTVVEVILFVLGDVRGHHLVRHPLPTPQ